MMSSQNTKRNPISYVICAAGLGERFTRYGIKTPKPLLKLNGHTMIERSIQSLDLQVSDQIIIVFQKKHKLKQKLANIITSIDWLEIDIDTRGQLETFLMAKDLIKNDEVVIYNCDTFFFANTLKSVIACGMYDGIIPCSREPGDAWSFCKVDEDYNVVQIAEKKRISDWASVGFYYFKDRNELIKLSNFELSEVGKNEVYVAPLYQRYLELNLKIKMVPVDQFLPFGTIEQLKDYWSISIEELIFQNK